MKTTVKMLRLVIPEKWFKGKIQDEIRLIRRFECGFFFTGEGMRSIPFVYSISLQEGQNHVTYVSPGEKMRIQGLIIDDLGIEALRIDGKVYKVKKDKLAEFTHWIDLLALCAFL